MVGAVFSYPLVFLESSDHFTFALFFSSDIESMIIIIVFTNIRIIRRASIVIGHRHLRHLLSYSTLSSAHETLFGLGTFVGDGRAVLSPLTDIIINNNNNNMNNNSVTLLRPAGHISGTSFCFRRTNTLLLFSRRRELWTKSRSLTSSSPRGDNTLSTASLASPPFSWTVRRHLQHPPGSSVYYSIIILCYIICPLHFTTRDIICYIYI